MLRWRVLGTQESDDWHGVLERFPQTDIYFLPEYHRALELNGDGEAHAFVVEQGERVFFHSFFVRSINKLGHTPIDTGWFDLESAYGYSGPLCTTTNKAFLSEAWSIFSDWCKTNHIVAEFIRFNPFLDNYRFADDPSKVILDRETIVLSLASSKTDLWEGYPSVQRNMVRKALKKGLVCQDVPVDEGLTEFRKLYNETMVRAGARCYYYFSDAYFDYLSQALGERVKLFAVQAGSRVVAAALFFLYGDRIHYHLAGSDSNYKEYAPNNLLLHTVAEWGQTRGLRWLHLGGGRSATPNDRLFSFKASISRSRLPFYIGKRVHNPDVYEALCSQWMTQMGVAERPNYFLIYRLGASN